MLKYYSFNWILLRGFLTQWPESEENRLTLSATKMYHRYSTFWRYKTYAHIRGHSASVCECLW